MLQEPAGSAKSVIAATGASPTPASAPFPATSTFPKHSEVTVPETTREEPSTLLMQAQPGLFMNGVDATQRESPESRQRGAREDGLTEPVQKEF